MFNTEHKARPMRDPTKLEFGPSHMKSCTKVEWVVKGLVSVQQ